MQRAQKKAERGALTLPRLICGLLLLFTLACDRESSAAGNELAGQGGAFGPRAAAAAEDPIDFGALSSFELTAQNGEPFGLADLEGRPWVLSCIFTTCTGPCPSITKSMAELARALEGTEARFVSISVDPARDHPAVLKRYADAYGADPSRWTFLTGEEGAVHELLRSGFKLPVARLDEPDPLTGDLLTHDRRLAVIDRRGHLRGWYDAEDPEERRLLEERVRFLLSEP